MEKRALTTGDLAAFCGVNHRTVLRWIKLGYLHSFQLPGRGDNRVTIAECIRFLRAHEIPVPEELANADVGVRILVVEDDRAMADFVTRLMQQEGFETETVFDGFQAGALLGTFKPSLMILDLNIPQLRGMEVLEFVRRTPALKSMKVLVTSAMPPADLEAARAAGADMVLAKPFKSQELLKTVYRLLGRKAPAKARKGQVANT